MMFKAEKLSELLNKRTNERFLLVEENKAVKILSDDGAGNYQLSEESADTIEITEKNQVNFKYLICHADRNTPNVQEFEADEDGILLKNGAPAMLNQGDVIVKKVLGTMPGALVLLVAGDEEGEDISLYDVERDTFRKVIYDVHNVETTKLGTSLIFVSKDKEDVPEEKDANGVVVTPASTNILDARVIALTTDGRHTRVGSALRTWYPEKVYALSDTAIVVETHDFKTGEDRSEVINSLGCRIEVINGTNVTAYDQTSRFITIVANGKMRAAGLEFPKGITAQLEGYALIDINGEKYFFADATGADSKVVTVKATPDRGYVFELA